MTSPPNSSVKDETLAEDEDRQVLLIVVRVHASSAEESSQLTDELAAFMRETAPGPEVLAQRADSGSPDEGWLLISLSRVVFLPSLISSLLGWKRRHGVSLLFPDVCVSGLESGPWRDPRLGRLPDSAPEPEPPAPLLGELLPRVQRLNEKLVVLAHRSAAVNFPLLADTAPAVSLADEDVAEFPLSDRQRRVLVIMLEAQELAARLYESLCDENERLLQQLKAKDQEIERLLQEGHARVRKVLAEADARKAQGDLDGALDCYQSVLPMSEALAEEARVKPPLQRELAALCWTLGTLKAPSNTKAARRKHLARALQLTVQMEAADPQAAGSFISSSKIRAALQRLP